MKKTIYILFILLLSSCYNLSERYVDGVGFVSIDNNADYGSFLTGDFETENISMQIDEQVLVEDITPAYKQTYKKKFLKTHETAEKFNLELPLRCDVNWESQSIISNQVLDEKAFFVERMDKGGQLPKLMIENISFKEETLHSILLKILENTEIELYSYDDLSTKVTIEDLSGSLNNVLSFIANDSKLYYEFKDRTKSLHFSRTGKWNIHVPFSKEIIISIEDALRGAGIDNLIVDWEDEVIIIEGDFITENVMRKTLTEFQKEKFLLAYDIDVYRLYSKTSGEINWIDMMKAFKRDSIKVSSKGIIGRAMSVSETIDLDAIKGYLKPIASPVLISRGTYVLPNHWQGRFDIGRCSREERLETDLFVMMETQFKKRVGRKDKLDMEMVLRTSQGDVSTFNLPSRLGENVLVLGIPTHYFVKEDETIINPNTELFMLVSPRLIEFISNDD